VYGLGSRDADGNPSKVCKEDFSRVCQEFGNPVELDLTCIPYINLEYAATIDEPSVIVGPRLRAFFRERLRKAGIKLHVNAAITAVERNKEFNTISLNGMRELPFDKVINATSFQTVLPKPIVLPFRAEPIYQICVAFIYRLTQTPVPSAPISFVVMDGWFPCLMPYDDRKERDTPLTKYLLTHGKWSILGSYSTAREARDRFPKVTQGLAFKLLREKCEEEMERFWPNFRLNFEYDTWVGSVLAKLKIESEFRSAFTFQSQENDMIYIFPGKISNIFRVGREVISLIAGGGKGVREEGGFRFVKGGTLAEARSEVIRKPGNLSFSTTGLQAHAEITSLLVKHELSHS
jgi:hypothetical protein